MIASVHNVLVWSSCLSSLFKAFLWDSKIHCLGWLGLEQPYRRPQISPYSKFTSGPFSVAFLTQKTKTKILYGGGRSGAKLPLGSTSDNCISDITTC